MTFARGFLQTLDASGLMPDADRNESLCILFIFAECHLLCEVYIICLSCLFCSRDSCGLHTVMRMLSSVRYAISPVYCLSLLE